MHGSGKFQPLTRGALSDAHQSTGRAGSWLLLGERQRGVPATLHVGRLLSEDRYDWLGS